MGLQGFFGVSLTILGASFWSGDVRDRESTVSINNNDKEKPFHITSFLKEEKGNHLKDIQNPGVGKGWKKNLQAKTYLVLPTYLLALPLKSIYLFLKF